MAHFIFLVFWPCPLMQKHISRSNVITKSHTEIFSHVTNDCKINNMGMMSVTFHQVQGKWNMTQDEHEDFLLDWTRRKSTEVWQRASRPFYRLSSLCLQALFTVLQAWLRDLGISLRDGTGHFHGNPLCILFIGTMETDVNWEIYEDGEKWGFPLLLASVLHVTVFPLLKHNSYSIFLKTTEFPRDLLWLKWYEYNTTGSSCHCGIRCFVYSWTSMDFTVLYSKVSKCPVLLHN